VESAGTETENVVVEVGAEAAAEPEPEAEPQPEVDPTLQPVPDETPEAAVARCETTGQPDTCITLALDERPSLRARERERVIEAHRALGNEDRMLDHMEAFVADYPRDRRGNRYNIALREAGRQPR
jgi:hypothetical protein